MPVSALNFQAGIRRLALVLGICYFVFSGLWVFVVDSKRSKQQFELARCLDAVCNPGTGNLLGPLKDTDCLTSYPPVSLRSEVIEFFFILVIPLFLGGALYAIWKVVSWIGRGFRPRSWTEPAP